MDELLAPILLELRIAWYNTQPVDFALPSFVCLWFVILLLPLHGMDRRDPIAGAVYALFCMGAGVCLMLALPKSYIDDPSIPLQFWAVVSMGSISFFRWTYQRQQEAVQVTKIADGQFKGLNHGKTK